MRHVQLRAFHEVAVCLSFSRAAEALGLTQPAISDQVRKLEASYDTVLFNRQKRQVRLTRTGERLFDVTRRLFAIEREARDLLSETQVLRSGTLRLVADSAHHLLHILAQFRAAYPSVRFDVRSGNSTEVVSALHAYDADLGVTAERPAGGAFEIIQLGASPLVAFASRAHYGDIGEITFERLAGMALVMREPGSKTRQAIETAAARVRCVLVPDIEAEGREAVREIVASGAGIGFVSRAEFGADPRLVCIPIVDSDAVMEETLLCLRERTQGKLVSAFLDVARAHAPSINGS